MLQLKHLSFVALLRPMVNLNVACHNVALDLRRIIAAQVRKQDGDLLRLQSIIAKVFLDLFYSAIGHFSMIDLCLDVYGLRRTTKAATQQRLSSTGTFAWRCCFNLNLDLIALLVSLFRLYGPTEAYFII